MESYKQLEFHVIIINTNNYMPDIHAFRAIGL